MAPSSLDVSILNSTSRLLAVLDLDEEHMMQNMEDIDIDQVMDVPDTPDRLATRKINNDGEDIEKVVNSSVAGDFGISDLLDSGVPNRVRGRCRLNTENGNNSRLYSRPRGDISIRDETEQSSRSIGTMTDSLSVSENALLFRRLMAEKVSAQPQPMEYVPSSSDRAKLDGDTSAISEVLGSDVKVQDRSRGKMIDSISSQKFFSNTSFSNNGRNMRSQMMLRGNTRSDTRKATCSDVPPRSSACEDDNGVMDLTGQNEYTGIPERVCSRGTSKDLVQEIRKVSTAASCSSSRSITNSSKVSSNGCKGKINTDDGANNSAYVGVDCGKGIDLSSESKPKIEQIMLRPLQSITSPRKTGKKRLVLNGCISPYNIARAKQTAESHDKCSTDGKQDDIGKVISNCETPSSQIHIVSPNSEGNQTDRIDRMKGKGIMAELSPAKDYDAKTMPLLSRSSLNPTEEVNGIGDASGDVFRYLEKKGGWRSTRNRSKKTSSSDEVSCLSRRNGGVGHLFDRSRENGMENRDCVNRTNTSLETDSLDVSDPVSFQHGLTTRSVRASSSVMSELDRENGQHHGANKLTKRHKKHASSRGNFSEHSTSTFDDSEVTYLWSSGEPTNARSMRSRDIHHRGISGPVIEIDELSPEVRCRNPEDTSQMVNDDSDVRARQVEADEILARQLQEQMYHELQGVGGGEIDASIAWTLQQEEDVQRASSLQSQRLLHPRDSSISHLYRQYPSRYFQNSSVRSANRARVPTSARMTRLRNSFHGHYPTVSSGERSFQFPPDMDFEMRIHILEALEDAVGNGNGTMAGDFFQVQRDFNENDYEMLLALDENNHQHVGASLDQINGLPQSTVQTVNFEEACAICLETPTTGDTIRHLPCLHKFHKDCIDPWLRRRTSCPICKSCIT